MLETIFQLYYYSPNTYHVTYICHDYAKLSMYVRRQLRYVFISETPIRDFTNIPITDYYWPILITDPITKLLAKSSHDYTMNCHETCLII